MAEKFDKMKCIKENYIVRNMKILIHFSLYKFQKHNSTIQRQDTIQHNEKTTYQKK